MLHALVSALEPLLHLIDRASEAADPEEVAVAQGGVLVLPLLQDVATLCGVLKHYLMVSSLLGGGVKCLHYDFTTAQ